MTIAEFDKLHDMLKIIHIENQAIMYLQTVHLPEQQSELEKFFDKAFSEAEQGRLKKWKTNGCKLD
jgi:hypothetical protein